MADIMYDRQSTLDLVVPSEVSIVGVGGIGSWVAIDLAMTGVEKLNLFDEDNLEMHNLNRLPFSPDDVGKPKTQVLAEFINDIRPQTTILAFGLVTPLTAGLLSNIVIDCTDKMAAQKLIYDICKKNGYAYYRVGYDGMHLTIIDGQHAKAITPKDVWGDEEGYTVVPSWLVPPQIGAAMITHMICSGLVFPSLSFHLNDLWKVNDDKK